MKKVTLQCPTVPVQSNQQRDTTIFWNLSMAVRRGTVSKDRVEKQINFILGNSRVCNPTLDKKLVELRHINRERKDVRNTL